MYQGIYDSFAKGFLWDFVMINTFKPFNFVAQSEMAKQKDLGLFGVLQKTFFQILAIQNFRALGRLVKNTGDTRLGKESDGLLGKK
ncbi:MAG: hypothetical protein A2992_07425 [Elusimicrobia bacterium RIFCSPLOWO2_01_FULL_59_12]|nr:MAG: hypothetical protein A2992_07425 [Elusimicrobia bacterium RIFCSPLOWO2_01_FULL_59_12]